MPPVFEYFPTASLDSRGPYYLTRRDGRLYVVLDTGGVWNTCGDDWAKLVASVAIKARLQPGQKKLARRLWR